MKKINSLVLLVVFGAASILSSCSSEKGLAVEKRKYRNGYSISWNGGKHETQQLVKAENENNVRSNELTEMPTIEATLANETTSPSPELFASSATSTPIVFNETTELKSAFTKSNETLKEDAGSSSKVDASTTTKKYTRAEIKQAKKFFSKKAPGDTDMPLWAYILISILLPPLAVGLYEGIHTPFWISILLTLLFWIPGVIYAIWRVTK
jgi:uncharacterized membrane protein YqaE (UPF0057 family)